MAEWRKYGEEIKDKVVSEYLACDKTIDELCFEHGISRTAVYHWLREKGLDLRRRNVKVPRTALYLSRDDVELLLLMLGQDTAIKRRYKTIAHSLETRLLGVADFMTEKESDQ